MKLTNLRLGLIIICLVLIALSWWAIVSVRGGVETQHFTANGTPAMAVFPKGDEPVPTVYIAHGFAASRYIMQGYAYSLAYAGYGAVLWDFDGHGDNVARLPASGSDELAENLQEVMRVSAEIDRIDTTRQALLGHSMGTGVVLGEAIANPDQYQAVIAVSPIGVSEGGGSAENIPNLLIMAGENEPAFVANGEAWLDVAGDTNEDKASGTARQLTIIPLVEHIGILFAPAAHNLTVEWLDATFGVQQSSGYTDSRVAWYGIQLIAWMLLLIAIAPLWREAATVETRGFVALIAPLGGVVLATFNLFLISYVVELRSMGGLLVGGALLAWLLMVGVTWFAGGYTPSTLKIRDVLLGIVLFGAFWLAFNAIGSHVWQPTWLISSRLTLWPIASLMLLPIAGASAHATVNGGFFKRFAWWLWQSVFLVGGLIITLQFLPALGFLLLIVPLLPVLLAITGIGAASVNRPWAAALGGALFLGWVISAFFPLA